MSNKYLDGEDFCATAEQIGRASATGQLTIEHIEDAVRYAIGSSFIGQKPKPTALSRAVQILARELKKDPSFKLSWQANIAMSFKDEVWNTTIVDDPALLDEIANKAAQRFLDCLMRDDESENTFDHYITGKKFKW